MEKESFFRKIIFYMRLTNVCLGVGFPIKYVNLIPLLTPRESSQGVPASYSNSQRSREADAKKGLRVFLLRKGSSNILMVS